MRRRSAAGFVLSLSLSMASLAAAAPDDAGRRLFAGETPLSGQIAGQELVLTSAALRCVNCHAAPGARAASGPVRATLGPALGADALLRVQPRRGGPPSRYDAAAFCRLLRTGIDPAQVMLQRVMPRYQISDADCAALWTVVSAAP